MKILYCFIIFAVVLTSCQKGIEPFDDSNPAPTEEALKGSWKFISATVHTESSQEYTQSGVDYKTVNISDYTTDNNTGIIMFGDSTLNYNNLSYTVTSYVISSNYENGVLVDTLHLPFITALDSTNFSGTYQLIGSDSIYFPQGNINISGSTTQTQPSGGKISIVDNALTISQATSQDSTYAILGVPYHIAIKATADMHFQKQ